MTRHLLISIIVLVVLVLTPLASTAQQQEPTIYPGHFTQPSQIHTEATHVQLEDSVYVAV